MQSENPDRTRVKKSLNGADFMANLSHSLALPPSVRLRD
jgi:hypothetical protein